MWATALRGVCLRLGRSRPEAEKDLLTFQNKYKASIFGCEGKNVFSDEVVDLGEGYSTIKVVDTYNEFHQVKRTETGSWVNWAMFFQVWWKVREMGVWNQKTDDQGGPRCCFPSCAHAHLAEWQGGHRAWCLL